MDANLEDRRSERGYTLIELIVVLVILGLLVTVVGVRFFGVASTGKEKAARIQIARLEEALQYYALEMGRLPDSSEGLDALVRNPGDYEYWNGPYLAKDLPKDPWQRDYVYRCPGDHGDFDLYSLGADGVEGNEDDICSWK